jgi:hypothetical protein
MGLGIDLEVHGTPQGNPNRRAVRRRDFLIGHDTLPVSIKI